MLFSTSLIVLAGLLTQASAEPLAGNVEERGLPPGTSLQRVT